MAGTVLSWGASENVVLGPVGCLHWQQPFSRRSWPQPQTSRCCKWPPLAAVSIAHHPHRDPRASEPQERRCPDKRRRQLDRPLSRPDMGMGRADVAGHLPVHHRSALGRMVAVLLGFAFAAVASLGFLVPARSRSRSRTRPTPRSSSLERILLKAQIVGMAAGVISLFVDEQISTRGNPCRLGRLQHLFLWRPGDCSDQPRCYTVARAKCERRRDASHHQDIRRNDLAPIASLAADDTRAALIAMFLAAGALQKVESAIAAAVFVFVIVTAAIRTNAPVWRRRPSASEITPRDALITTTRLVVLAFSGAASPSSRSISAPAFAGSTAGNTAPAMVLIAGAYAYYLSRLRDPHDDWSKPSGNRARWCDLPPIRLSPIGAGLVWLISSGKLATLRGDWAANQLFLAGGFAVICLSAIIVKTNSALAERHAAN